VIGIVGHKTTIAQAFVQLLPKEEDHQEHRLERLPVWHDRYLICSGRLVGASLSDIRREDGHAVWDDNFMQIATVLDTILASNTKARVCVIGSESGYSGSHDMAYAGAKAALHLYVETKKLLFPDQQLVAIAPSIIEDSGMTRRRTDIDRVVERAQRNPKGRLLAAREVARLAYFLLYEDQGYISGTVIRMNGGEKR